MTALQLTKHENPLPLHSWSELFATLVQEVQELQELPCLAFTSLRLPFLALAELDLASA